MVRAAAHSLSPAEMQQQQLQDYCLRLSEQLPDVLPMHVMQAAAQALHRYAAGHDSLQLLLEAIGANDGSDCEALVRYFNTAMKIEGQMDSVRGVKSVVLAIAALPGTSNASIETGSGMTLATAARMLIVHHVLGTQPCSKPNRSRGLAPKRRRRVYDQFMQAARNLPSVESMCHLLAPQSHTEPPSKVARIDDFTNVFTISEQEGPNPRPEGGWDHEQILLHFPLPDEEPPTTSWHPDPQSHATTNSTDNPSGPILSQYDTTTTQDDNSTDYFPQALTDSSLQSPSDDPADLTAWLMEGGVWDLFPAVDGAYEEAIDLA